MYLLAKFGGHKSYQNGDINSYISSYMNTSEKAKLTASVHHIARYLKPRILIVLGMAGRKTTQEEHRQLQSVCFTKELLYKKQ